MGWRAHAQEAAISTHTSWLGVTRLVLSRSFALWMVSAVPRVRDTDERQRTAALFAAARQAAERLAIHKRFGRELFEVLPLAQREGGFRLWRVL